MSTLEELRRWYDRDLSRYAPWDKSVEIVGLDENAELEARPRHLRFRVYTDSNCYHIKAQEALAGHLGYLGCTASSRKPRAGENWHRGNDLHDGPFTEETWHRILGDILGYELVGVSYRSGVFREAYLRSRGVPDSPPMPTVVRPPTQAIVTAPDVSTPATPTRLADDPSAIGDPTPA